MTMEPKPAHNTRFRERDMLALTSGILDGDSMDLVGVGSIGKSHFVRHLTCNRAAQEYCLRAYGAGTQPEDIVYIVVDPNELLALPGEDAPPNVPPAWFGIELFMRQVIVAAKRRVRLGGVSLDVERMEAAYERLFNTDRLGPMRAYVYFKDAVLALSDSLPPQGKIVFVFDEFERLLSLPDVFFLNLRGLRDNLRYRLLYIAASRQEVASVMQDRLPALEPFVELFRKQVYLGPFQRVEDFDDMLGFLVKRKAPDYPELPPRVVENLRHLTGGHAGLMRTCFEYHDLILRTLADTEFIAEMLSKPMVVQECRTILESFDKQEIRALQDLVSDSQTGQSLSPLLLERLVQKHVVVVDDTGRLHVVPRLLRAYIAGQSAGLMQ